MDKSKIDKLKELSELYKAGILTKEEVEQEKNKILGNLQEPVENEMSSTADPNEEEISQQNDIDEEKPSEISQNYPFYENDGDDEDEIKEARKKKLIYGGITLLILLGIGVFIGLYQHRQNQIENAKVKVKEQEMHIDSITPEEVVKNYAEYFAQKMSLHQIDSIKFSYPEIINAYSFNPIDKSKFTVLTTPDPSVFIINYGNISLRVKRLNNNDIKVLESKGLFTFPSQKLDIARKTGMWNDNLSDVELNQRMSDDEFFKFIEDQDTSPDVWLISIGQIKKPTSYDDRIAHQELTNHTLHEIKGKDYSVIVRGRSDGPATDDYNGGWEEFEYTKPGKNIPALGSVTYDLEWYFRVEEEIVGINWNISDEEIFDKYLSYSGNEYDNYIASKRKVHAKK